MRLSRDSRRHCRPLFLALAVLLTAGVSADAQQKLLTLDDLYDPVKKVDFGGAQPTGLVWLDDQTAANRAARVEQKTADLAWMRQVAPQVMTAAAAGGSTSSNESLVVLGDRTGREAGLGNAIRDQSPSGEHGLRLRLESASFDDMVTWLVILQQQHGVRVDAATIDAAGAPGLVNASLTLAHGAAPGP